MHSPSLQPKHFEELAKSSGINCNLAYLNFISVEGTASYEYLLFSERIPRTNTGQVSSWWLRRYAHVATGGWWCSGLDPLNNWCLMEWGCYKPNHPRQVSIPNRDLDFRLPYILPEDSATTDRSNNKLIKYEHPPCTPTRVFCLKVPLDTWQQISSRYGVQMPQNIVVTELGEALGFWQWVMEQKISLIICEGAKKAAALLTQGYVAIALPGITSGYRVTRDFEGKPSSRQMIPDLAIFTQSVRTFYICFDYETQPKTIKAVNNAIAQLGELLEQKGCPVKVIRLPGLEKGVDEFIVAQGVTAFQAVCEASVDLKTDLAKTKPYTELTYPPALTLNRRYLEKVPFPTSGLIGVKSAKGTGKTTALLPLVKEALKIGRPVLLITHRIQLGRFLCNKIGVDWINHNTEQTPLGLGLCFNSIWKLNPEHWQGAVITGRTHLVNKKA